VLSWSKSTCILKTLISTSWTTWGFKRLPDEGLTIKFPVSLAESIKLFLRREFSASFRALEPLEAAEVDDVDEDVVEVKQFSLVDIVVLFHFL